MAERTPHRNLQRGTQMSFQGNRKENRRQYGGTQAAGSGLGRSEIPVGGKAFEIVNWKHEHENGDKEGRIQDGGRLSRNMAIESRKLCPENVCQPVEDAFGSERFDATNADVVVQKVDEWLKHRSDSMSSIEFDNEIKTSVEDYEFNRLDTDENYTTSPGDLTQKSSRIGDLFRCVPTLVYSDLGGTPRVAPPDGATTSLQYSPKVQAPPVYCMYENANPATVYGQEDKVAKSDSSLDAAKSDPEAFRVLRLAGDDVKSKCELESIMLMTPQELERMPESGIEFEESVGPKEFEVPCKEERVTDEESAAVDGMQVIQGGDVEYGELDGIPLSVPSTLATICISTDNDTNTTSIIFDTELGQRELKINTANLMQAAATLQPITLADLVAQDLTPVLQADANLSADVLEEYSEVGPEMSCVGDSIDEELLTPESPEKFPVKGCKREEKDPGGAVCTHTGRCKKVWTCPEPYCEKVFTKQCKLKVHLMSHSGIRPFKCDADGCDWAFTTLYKLKRHLETHCGEKHFTCDFDGCKRRFTTIYNLNSHKKLHALPNSVVCPIDDCHEHFPSRRKMELHMKEHGEIDAPYKCSVESCGKTYYTANSMASHLRVHQKANFQCTFNGCNKIFDKLSRYKVHVWHHTGEKPYMCNFEGCTWAFSSASKLKRHTRKHTGERKYPCKEPGCNKSFMRLEHLQGHMVTHRGDKPFMCPHENCDARFTARSSLYVHLKKHGSSMEKVVYPCPIENCDKKYNCKSSLRIHMLRYHAPALADSGQLDLVTLLANEDLQDSTVIENYEQQNTISVTVQDDALEATLMNAQELLQSHGEQALTTNILPQQVEVATMIIGEMAADVSQTMSGNISTAICPPVLITSPQSEIDKFSTVSVRQENNSGAARTDFCSNHMMMKRKRQQSKKILGPTLESASLHDQVFTALASPQLTSNDVILTSSAISFHNSTSTSIRFIQNQLLSDDPPPPHGDVYQEDGLLTSMANELAVPISLLAESSGGDASGQTTDFGSSQSTVVKYTGTTINLQDLE